MVVFDPLLPSTIRDPYSEYARLREQGPVVWHDHIEGWLLTRYRECVAVYRDPCRFSRDWRKAGYPVPASVLSIQTLDAPEHARLRNLLLAG